MNSAFPGGCGVWIEHPKAVAGSPRLPSLGHIQPLARGPGFPPFLSSVWSLQFFCAFPGADPVPPLVSSSFHGSLNSGHWGEQPVSTCRASGLSACSLSMPGPPFLGSASSAGRGRQPAGLPCQVFMLWGWGMVVLAALGPAGQPGGVFHPRPADPALHAALAPGAVVWEPLCC